LKREKIRHSGAISRAPFLGGFAPLSELIVLAWLGARAVFGEADSCVIKQFPWIGAAAAAGPFFVADDVETVVYNRWMAAFDSLNQQIQRRILGIGKADPLGMLFGESVVLGLGHAEKFHVVGGADGEHLDADGALVHRFDRLIPWQHFLAGVPGGAILRHHAVNLAFTIDQIVGGYFGGFVKIDLLIDIIRMIRMHRHEAGKVQDDVIDDDIGGAVGGLGEQ